MLLILKLKFLFNLLIFFHLIFINYKNNNINLMKNIILIIKVYWTFINYKFNI